MKSMNSYSFFTLFTFLIFIFHPFFHKYLIGGLWVHNISSQIVYCLHRQTEELFQIFRAYFEPHFSIKLFWKYVPPRSTSHGAVVSFTYQTCKPPGPYPSWVGQLPCTGLVACPVHPCWQQGPWWLLSPPSLGL